MSIFRSCWQFVLLKRMRTLSYVVKVSIRHEKLDFESLFSTEWVFRSSLDGDMGAASFSLQFSLRILLVFIFFIHSPPSSFSLYLSRSILSHSTFLIDNKPLRDYIVRSRLQFQLNYAEFEGPIVRYAKSFACGLNVRADAVGGVTTYSPLAEVTMVN